MRRHLLLATAIVALQAASAGAVDKQSQYMILGPGAYGCDRVIGELARDAQAKSPASVIIYSNWLAGNLTSYNRDAKATYSILGKTSFDEAFTWTLEYCNDNRDSIYSAAVDALIAKLKARRSIDMPKTAPKPEQPYENESNGNYERGAASKNAGPGTTVKPYPNDKEYDDQVDEDDREYENDDRQRGSRR